MRYPGFDFASLFRKGGRELRVDESDKSRWEERDSALLRAIRDAGFSLLDDCTISWERTISVFLAYQAHV